MYNALKTRVVFLQHMTDRTWSKIDATKPRTIPQFDSTQYNLLKTSRNSFIGQQTLIDDETNFLI